MSDKIRVLFLPLWYPSRLDPMPGLFIRRQAEALTPHCDVAVICVYPDPDCKTNYEVEFAEENQVRVLRVFYRTPKSAVAPLASAIRLYRFYHAVMKASRSIRQFKPQVVHAHILTRMGYLGLKVAGIYKAPLLLSEHWSRYMAANGTFTGTIRKWVTRFVVRKADALIPVSKALQDAMQSHGLRNRLTQVVPNVVDTSLFHPRQEALQDTKKTILHVSCFDDRSKNISGLLRALQMVSQRRSDFRCILVGDGPDFVEMQCYAKDLGIFNTFVLFSGMVDHSLLHEQYKACDMTVISSRYETFGTVSIESLSSGVPVVSTNTGIAAELINVKNGILVPANDEVALAEGIIEMLDRCRSLDPQQIRHSIQDRFTPEIVGRELSGLYTTVLDKKRLR